MHIQAVIGCRDIEDCREVKGTIRISQNEKRLIGWKETHRWNREKEADRIKEERDRECTF
jgi:hypothetical protein